MAHIWTFGMSVYWAAFMQSNSLSYNIISQTNESNFASLPCTLKELCMQV